MKRASPISSRRKQKSVKLEPLENKKTEQAKCKQADKVVKYRWAGAWAGMGDGTILQVKHMF